MKRIILAAASVALFAGSASAQSVNQTVTFEGEVAAKCGISAQSSSFVLNSDLTDSAARVRAAVTQEIADGLNNARIVGFCNGLNNNVTVERDVLARDGATGNGLTDGGYAQFIRYNLDASINGLPLDSTGTPGATTVTQRFGGHISLSDSNTHIRFAPSASNGTAVATSNGATRNAATGWSSLTDRRLAAGDYTGAVTVTLSPAA